MRVRWYLYSSREAIELKPRDVVLLGDCSGNLLSADATWLCPHDTQTLLHPLSLKLRQWIVNSGSTVLGLLGVVGSPARYWLSELPAESAERWCAPFREVDADALPEAVRRTLDASSGVGV